MAKKKHKEPNYDRLHKNVSAIVHEFQPLLQRAEKLGIFLGDRELLECKKCGLQEDVASNGALIVAKRKNPGVDIGLRFKEIKKKSSLYRCPLCKRTIKAVLL